MRQYSGRSIRADSDRRSVSTCRRTTARCVRLTACTVRQAITLRDRERPACPTADGTPLDVITFSGNGEPTMHPDFGAIIDDTISLRDKYFPEVKISVLSNSTRLHLPDVVEALKRIDNNILKLDSASDRTVALLDRPVDSRYTVDDVIERLKAFDGNVIVQTMITSGEPDGVAVDNSTNEEIDALIEAYRRIRPKEIMIYTIDRRTPERSLRHVSREELERIAQRITDATGIGVQVSG